MASCARRLPAAALALAFGLPLAGQATNDPFPTPIDTSRGTTVGVREFATIPDVDGAAPRLMLLVDEPGTRRLFVNAQTGQIFTVGYDGGTVTPYLDMADAKWGVHVLSTGREHGFQSFALHPQFAQRGAPGYGKLYTWGDVDAGGRTDFQPGGGQHVGDNLLLEWTAKDPAAAVYDGGAPRELFRIEDPFNNHNGGRTAFNPLAKPGDSDYGLLYVGVADGGSAGDPLNNAQNLASPFGKIFRIDPLGSNSANGKYGVPAANPFAGDADARTLGEIYAYGVRNTQQFAWDGATGRMFITDIGQNVVEEVDTVTAGADLGWNAWEATFRYGRSGISTANRRGDPKVTYPFVEYDHRDPLFPTGRVAVTGLVVYRGSDVPALRGMVVFGDLPSGEMFYVPADRLPQGGQDPIRRVLFSTGSGAPKTFLELIQEKNRQQRKEPSARADLRFHPGNAGRVYLLNKGDGVIRLLTAGP